MIRMASYLKKDFDFSFYRTKSGAEVDLIVERYDGKCFAIEIKGSDYVLESRLSGLKSFKEVRKDAILLCASLAKRRYSLDDITVYPWEKVFEVIFT